MPSPAIYNKKAKWRHIEHIETNTDKTNIMNTYSVTIYGLKTKKSIEANVNAKTFSALKAKLTKNVSKALGMTKSEFLKKCGFDSEYDPDFSFMMNVQLSFEVHGDEDGYSKRGEFATTSFRNFKRKTPW